MKRVLLLTVPLVALAALVTAALSSARSDFVPTVSQHSLEIRFERVGCHSWSLDGGAFTARQSLRLRVGDSIVVKNHDVCSHTLVQAAGMPLSLENQAAGASPRHVHVIGYPDYVQQTPIALSTRPGEMLFGSESRATFTTPGTYELVTHEGEPTLPGDWSTLGPDNQLLLHVQVDAGHQNPE